MENIKLKKTGNTLTLTTDLSVEGEASSTGAMILVAKSGGWKNIPGTDLRVNLMIGRANPDHESD